MSESLQSKLTYRDHRTLEGEPEIHVHYKKRETNPERDDRFTNPEFEEVTVSVIGRQYEYESNVGIGPTFTVNQGKRTTHGKVETLLRDYEKRLKKLPKSFRKVIGI